MEMLCRVFVPRRVATPDMSAFETHAQMNPCIPCFYAVFANVLLGAGDPNLVEMLALRHDCFAPRAVVLADLSHGRPQAASKFLHLRHN